MIVRRCWSLILLSTGLILCVRIGGISGERWSRQVSTNDWIPLANPRSTSNQIRTSNVGNEAVSSGSSTLPHLPSLSLPPALQEQYQQQLLQLQKTQENIQKLLILQEQLRTQQQLLQSQTLLPSNFGSPENEKRMLQQNTIPNLQGISGLSSDVLVPPLPSPDALPPIYSAQNFLSQGLQRFHQPVKGNQNLNVKNEEFGNLHNGKSQVYSEGHEDRLREEQSPDQLSQVDIRENVKDFVEKQEKYRPAGKQVKGQTAHGISGLPENVENENEEVQLVYVPLETLAQQRGQPKRLRGQKQYPFRQQQHQEQQQQYRINDGVEQTTKEPDTFARDLLDQLEFVKEERSKEITRMEDVKKALERKAQLEQEILQKEQELARQREEERRRKELEKLEEIAKQRELERLREAREKQRLEELERRRIAEARAKEEKRRQEEEARQRENERLAALEKQKQLDIQRALEEQRKLEEQRQVEASTVTPNINQNQPDTQTLPLVRNKQLQRQHVTETSNKVKHRNRVRQPRPRINQQLPTTTPPPSPNQPPLSVYMGGDSMAPERVKISDVLRILKDAKTIAVLDTVVPNTPKVFVGPTNLDPPFGYTKFDLPYLSSIDHNRVERKVDKLPFFVAPLSFDPPPGYSKIPFPAPHIGSVVVNTIDASAPEPDTPETIHNFSPTPLIEPNSYIDGTGSDLSRIDPTTLGYEHSTTAGYTQELSSTPKYDTSYSTISTPSGSRFRFRQSYGDNNPPSVIDTIYQGEPSLPIGKAKQKTYYDEDSRHVVPTLAHDTRLGITGTTYQEEAIYSSTPNYPEQSSRTLDDPSTKEQDLAAQLALINRELAQQRNANNNKNNNNNNKDSFVENHNTYTQSNPHFINSFQSLVSSNDANEVRGPTQYNLPAELPISPHLPGLVNSLLEKQTTIPTTTTTEVVTTPAIITTTTTTTTPRPPSTTYRPRSRHRSRIVPTRPTTTTTPTTPGTRASDRSRRPYSRTRSGSRYTTTTESYNDSPVYEPTKSKHSETTQKYNYIDHHKRPRGQKHRNNDKTAYQSEAYDQNYNIQAHQAAIYEHSAPDGSITSTPTDSYSQSGTPSHNSKQQESSIPTSNLNAFSQENYPSTIVGSTENYPPSRETTPNYNTPVATEDYSKGQNYPQNYPQDANYPTAYGSQLDELDQTVLEKAPVNGFNYQAQNSEARNQPTVQKSKDYTAYYAEKLENTDFGLSGTSENPRSKIDETAQQYSPPYEVAPVQSHLNYPPTGEHGNFGQVEDRKVDGSSVVADPNEEPIFIPLPPEKQEVYDLLAPPTEEPLTTMTTQTSTTTEATPVVIRQRVRGRVGTRTHSDSVVQTRPRGSQDEFVRFSAVNQQDAPRSSGHRHRTKSRSRPQSQVKTSGYDYVKIQAGSQRQRSLVQQTTPSTTTSTTTTTTTTTTTPRTTTTTTTEQPLEEDIDYGFIRPPSFRPVHPVDNRFHAPPVTFKPILPQINNLPIQQQQQPSASAQETEIEYNPPPSHSLKNRPKYHTTNRRPSIKSTILPITTPIITTTTENIPQATINPDNSVYTVRPNYKPEDIKQSRTRTRTRRPGRKRLTTTSTTESSYDVNNEVPLEGNYPRVLPALPETVGEQQTLYDENFDSLSQFGETYNQPDQSYKSITENYPPQDFVLNFGAVAPQTQVQQEEYDQTQLGNNSPQKYSHSTNLKSTTLSDTHLMPADIYGAESQWSTKLSRTSFQPSFAANYATGGFNEERTKQENIKEVTDIITVRPENSLTFVVSSELKNSDGMKLMMDEEESMAKGTTVFGQKMTMRDHTESPMKRQQKVSSLENYDDERWRSKEENLSKESTEKEDDEKILKKTSDPVGVRKTNRRKRVRVRVRPIIDDFVTAESQHINAAVNSLMQDQYKYNPIRQRKFSVNKSSITRSTDDGSRRFVLEDFLEEMFKNDDVSLPILATSTSTVLPLNVWLTSTPMTSPYEEEETMNYKFLRTTTNIPTTMPEELERTLDPEETLKTTTQYYGTRINSKDSITRESTENIKIPTTQETGTIITTDFSNSQTTLNDLNSIDISLETTPIVEKSEITTIKTIDTTTENFPIVESTKTEESKDNDDISYPKNHRAKWSEVRYPSDPSIALNHSLFSTWNYDKNGKISDWNKISKKDIGNKEGNNTEVKILTDYVQNVFDDLKENRENKKRSNERSMNNEKNNKIGSLENSREDNEVKTNSPLETSSISVRKDTSQAEDNSSIKLEQEETPTTIAMQNDEDESSSTSEYHSNPTVILDTEIHDILSKDESMVTVTPTSLSTTTTTTTMTTLPTTSEYNTISEHNTTETILGKVLRTSTTTKVSHMTEICYRGRCVMTKPEREIRLR